MNKIKYTALLLILFWSNSFQSSCQNTFDFEAFRNYPAGEKISHYHLIRTQDSLTPQNIHILTVPLKSLGTKYKLDLTWSDSVLYKTSTFADKSNAIAAVNAGFFNIKKGGSVTFLEYDNTLVSLRSWKGDIQAGKKTNFNGAFIILNTGKPLIEMTRLSSDYLSSDAERAVLVTGPVLLLEGNKTQLLDRSFVNKRHPRTCVGLTEDKMLLISIDGRHDEAKGMNLHELQDFLLNLGCINAINLDGGGSTSMWLKNDTVHGLINCPSDNKIFDNKGERKVANALILLSN